MLDRGDSLRGTMHGSRKRELDEREPADYHIKMRWTDHREVFVCAHNGGVIVINGRLLWRRLREILAKFITGIAALEAMAVNKGFSVTISPDRGTIQPQSRRKPKTSSETS